MEGTSTLSIQNFIRFFLTRKKYVTKLRLQHKRKNVINELISTEIEYVSNLQIVFDTFLKPMKEHIKEDTTQSENLELFSLLKVIYSDIFVIIGFQNKFLEELKQRTSASEIMEIGDLFLNFVVYMKTYLTYMNHYQRIIPILSSIKNNPVGQQLDSLKSNSCKGKGLKDFLIMPVQRIPRYALLLRDILKNTWEDHKDYEILKQSETMVLELADKIDVMLEEFKSLEKLMKLHNNIIFKKGSEIVLLVPHRKLIADITEIRVQFSSEKLPIQRRMIIFNDIILFTSVQPTKKSSNYLVDKFLYTDSLSLRYSEKDGQIFVMLRSKNNTHTNIYPTNFDTLQPILEQTLSKKVDKRKIVPTLLMGSNFGNNNNNNNNDEVESSRPLSARKELTKVIRSISVDSVNLLKRSKEDHNNNNNNNNNNHNNHNNNNNHHHQHKEKTTKEKSGNIFSRRKSSMVLNVDDSHRLSHSISSVCLDQEITTTTTKKQKKSLSLYSLSRSQTSAEIFQDASGKKKYRKLSIHNSSDNNNNNNNNNNDDKDDKASPSPRMHINKSQSDKGSAIEKATIEVNDIRPITDRPSVTPRGDVSSSKNRFLQELSSHLNRDD